MARTKTADPSGGPRSGAKEIKPRAKLPLTRPATQADIIALSQRYGPACINALADEVANGEGSARVAAARELLDRAYGKATQAVKVSGELTHDLPDQVNNMLANLYAGGSSCCPEPAQGA